MTRLIRVCIDTDTETIYDIINDSARAYEGHIPPDRYHQPYMAKDELLAEIVDGIVFHGYEDRGSLVAIMGIQDRGPVILIRHAYTRTEERGKGFGTRLLGHLLELTTKPVLIGTWRDAEWAVRFYQKHGFKLVDEEQKDRLLREYWSIPQRQVETSVVLADSRYWETLASESRRHVGKEP
ncbi:GNAT family N-acetyltransferase [Chloroflexota bacterium]